MGGGHTTRARRRTLEVITMLEHQMRTAAWPRRNLLRAAPTAGATVISERWPRYREACRGL